MNSMEGATNMQRAHASPSTRRGFTATELGAAVALAAIGTTLGLPSVSGIIAGEGAQTYASALDSALAKTSAEALALKRSVTLQPKPGGWASGWQILDSKNAVLDDYTAAPGATVTGPLAVTYRASGRLPVGGIAPKFQITTASFIMISHQCVSVDSSGRPHRQARVTC
jgi:Tfp pilus assembly protein FimT